MSARILITEPIVDSVIEKLRADFTVDIGERGQFASEDSLIEVMGQYDALLPMLSNPVTAGVIQAGTRLKIIANHAVGYNNIDIEAARKAEIHVANTPDVLTEACADFTMGLLLGLARHINAAEDYLRDGQFNGWEPLGFLGTELNGRTLGIFGMGRIGSAVALRARAFGLNIIYHNRSRVEKELEEELQATYVSTRQALARQSDILSLHCPLNEQTRHAIDASFMQQMPNHALIINTARGPVIEEKALAEALHNGQLAGAALDVFENEPNIDPRLLQGPHCLLTPHIASATHQTRRAIGEKAADAIRSVLNGEEPAVISNLLTE